MGGGEPTLGDVLWNKTGKLKPNQDWEEVIRGGFLGPPDIEIMPLLIFGAGGYQYANGGMAEMGVNFMSNHVEFASAFELSPYDFGDGVHLMAFELGFPAAAHKLSNIFRKPAHK